MKIYKSISFSSTPILTSQSQDLTIEGKGFVLRVNAPHTLLQHRPADSSKRKLYSPRKNICLILCLAKSVAYKETE